MSEPTQLVKKRKRRKSKRKVRLASSYVMPSKITLSSILRRVRKSLKNKKTQRKLVRLGVLGAIGAAMASSSAVAFGGLPGGGTPVDPEGVVPEISAIEGTAALAVVAALMLLTWERRRRQTSV